MDIVDDMGVSKLSAKDFFKVNYSFNVKKQTNFSAVEVKFTFVRLSNCSHACLTVIEDDLKQERGNVLYIRDSG